MLNQKQDRENINGYYQIDEKHINEMIAKVDDSGNLIISENFSLLDNENCSDKEVNNFTTSERKTFNKNGIMIEREFKSFGENKLQENINDVKIDSALYIPRSAFELASDFNNNYIERTLLRREMLDTARLIYKDNLNNIEYQTTVKLNEYNGLKNMSIQGYQDYPEDIVISPISKFEIEQKKERVKSGIENMEVKNGKKWSRKTKKYTGRPSIWEKLKKEKVIDSFKRGLKNKEIMELFKIKESTFFKIKSELKEQNLI